MSFFGRCSTWAARIAHASRYYSTRLVAIGGAHGVVPDGSISLTFNRETEAGSDRYLRVILSPDDLEFLAASPAFIEAIDAAKRITRALCPQCGVSYDDSDNGPTLCPECGADLCDSRDEVTS